MSLPLIKIAVTYQEEPKTVSVSVLEELHCQFIGTGPAQISSCGCLTSGQVCYRFVTAQGHLVDRPCDGL